ncbi:hypothetical protein B0H13DRAFT_624278 [Mycena leptocephala]|nr:hypothetical protein B0H13DRAFT_624278 [Mycena leptocephala]
MLCTTTGVPSHPDDYLPLHTLLSLTPRLYRSIVNGAYLSLTPASRPCPAIKLHTFSNPPTHTSSLRPRGSATASTPARPSNDASPTASLPSARAITIHPHPTSIQSTCSQNTHAAYKNPAASSTPAHATAASLFTAHAAHHDPAARALRHARAPLHIYEPSARRWPHIHSHSHTARVTCE